MATDVYNDTPVDSHLSIQAHDTILTSLWRMPDGRLVRTVVRLNSYHFQSSARVHMWSNERGWVEVWSLQYTEMASVGVGHGSPDRAVLEQALRDDEYHLLSSAEAILS